MHESHHILDIKKKQIETNLGALFQQVKNAIAEVMNCLETRDLNGCERVMQNDVMLNEQRRIIEQDCLVAIASQQPVANDLRDIVADMRIASELERMGDYAGDIAASILRMDDASLKTMCLQDILDMSVMCRQMLTDTMVAHQAGNADQARSVKTLDDQLDAKLSGLVNQVMDAMRADPAMVNNGSRILWIAHNLERYGDRATNIAEQVVYRLEGNVEDLS